MAVAPSIGRASRVERSPAPEASATQDLYERYAGQVFGYCLHQLGTREEAEDAVQSTFLNAFRGLKRGVVPEQEAAWLFKIAQNVCLSRRRSSWRRGRIESPTDFELVQELTPAPSRRGDELMGLQDVLEGMPESQRRAILLREWQGLSYREIADELDLSQGAVETLIFRARRSLAQGLEQPPEPKRARGRTRRGVDLGGLAAGIKSLLVGGAGAAKVAATVAVVGGTVAASVPVEHHLARIHRAPARPPAAATTKASRPAPRAPARPAAPPPAAPAPRPAERPVVHRAPATRPQRSSRPATRVPVAEPPAAPASVVPAAAPQPSDAPPAGVQEPGGGRTPAAPSHGRWSETPPGQADRSQPSYGDGGRSGGESGGSGASSGMHGAPPIASQPVTQLPQDSPTPADAPTQSGDTWSGGNDGAPSGGDGHGGDWGHSGH